MANNKCSVCQGITLLNTSENKRRRKEATEGPYKDVFQTFMGYLAILTELNTELSAIIRQMREKKRREILKGQSFRKRKSPPSDLTISVEGRKARATFHGKEAQFMWEAICATILPLRYSKFIRNMSLVYLIAEFESFLQGILRVTYEKKPETLITRQKSITYEELLRLGNTADIKHEIIQRELLSVLSQDIDEIRKYFRQRFGINISKLVNWKLFRERFYRRNILIHNKGLINRIYRLKTGYKGKDKRLEVSANYLDKSVELFAEVSKKIFEYFNEKFA